MVYRLTMFVEAGDTFTGYRKNRNCQGVLLKCADTCKVALDKKKTLRRAATVQC